MKIAVQTMYSIREREKKKEFNYIHVEREQRHVMSQSSATRVTV